jgi:hypothetical protein
MRVELSPVILRNEIFAILQKAVAIAQRNQLEEFVSQIEDEVSHHFLNAAAEDYPHHPEILASAHRPYTKVSPARGALCPWRIATTACWHSAPAVISR